MKLAVVAKKRCQGNQKTMYIISKTKLKSFSKKIEFLAKPEFIFSDPLYHMHTVQFSPNRNPVYKCTGSR